MASFGSKLLQTLVQNPLGNAVVGKVGKALTTVGSAIHAPQLSSGGLGAKLQSTAGYFAPQKAYADEGTLGISTGPVDMTPAEREARQRSQQVYSSQPTNTGGGLGGSETINPSTSGQTGSPTGGGGSTGGGMGDYLQSLYGNSRSALESLIPTYDADLSNYQTQVNNTIGQAQTARDQQLADNTQKYGQALKQQLQNSGDLRQRTQSTFAGLGSLDSSAYGDELLKQQQNDADNSSALQLQQGKDETNINNTFTNFKQDQMSRMDSYQQEINRAKQGVRQAMANNDIGAAQDLANYATNLQNTINGFSSNLASAQAAGTDVIGNLKKINGSDFLNSFGQLLAGQYNNGVNKYALPSQGASGQGYIGSGAGITPQQKKLLGLA